MKEEFIRGLKILIRSEYNSEKVSDYAFKFYLDNKIEDSNLLEVVEDIMIMDAGLEFALTKEELIKLICDKLEIIWR